MVIQQRYVFHARIFGAMLRNAPKMKVFMVSVQWSDESEVIVYRSFQEFKKFHGHLKKRFPHLNPLKKSERVIPKFRVRSIKIKLEQNSSRRSIHQMKLLDDYCSELLKCDLYVIQSSEVNQFFTSKPADLQFDCTKNCIMVLPSDVLSEGLGGGVIDFNREPTGSVTHPFVTQTYRCVAHYETKDTNNRPFKVALNEVLNVLIKDPAGWWLVENKHKHLAWFPAPYLEAIEEGNDDDDNDDGTCLEENSLYCALRKYTSKKPDEVSVSIGSVMNVLRKTNDGWWLVRTNGKTGYVPSMYLQPYNDPQACIYSLQRKLCSSTLNLAMSSSTIASSFPSAMKKQTPTCNGVSLSPPEQSDPDRATQPRNARSLDVLSEGPCHTAFQRDVSAADGCKGSMSSGNSSHYSISAGSTTSSQSSSRSKGVHNPAGSATYSSLGGLSSTDLSLSYQSVPAGSSYASEYAQDRPGSTMSKMTPSVPPRPNAQEILTRCTTMTRKAALASSDRLRTELKNLHFNTDLYAVSLDSVQTCLQQALL